MHSPSRPHDCRSGDGPLVKTNPVVLDMKFARARVMVEWGGRLSHIPAVDEWDRGVIRYRRTNFKINTVTDTRTCTGISLSRSNAFSVKWEVSGFQFVVLSSCRVTGENQCSSVCKWFGFCFDVCRSQQFSSFLTGVSWLRQFVRLTLNSHLLPQLIESSSTSCFWGSTPLTFQFETLSRINHHLLYSFYISVHLISEWECSCRYLNIAWDERVLTFIDLTSIVTRHLVTLWRHAVSDSSICVLMHNRSQVPDGAFS